MKITVDMKLTTILITIICIILIISPVCNAGLNVKELVKENYDIDMRKLTTSSESTGTEYWALLVAVGIYLNHPEQNRHSMLREVEDLYDTLLSFNYWRESNIKKIKAEDATLSNIINGFRWLDDVEDKDDVSLVYLTTHGFHLNFDIPPFDEDDGEDEALVPYEGFDDKNKFLWDDLLNFWF